MKLFFTLLATFCVLQINAQFTLQATITDEQNQTIPFANVVLLDNNQSIYKGTTTNDNGNFTIENIAKGNYTLNISFIGYKTLEQALTINSDTNLNTLILKTSNENLEAVELTIKRPTVKRKVDRLVFNVENTILSTGNAWDVLKKTPGLIVNQDNMMIKNSNAIIILINDKRVYLSNSELKDLLEGTSASDITSVEVITNPPAKYEAEGSSVLNIKMKKNLATGYKATIGGTFRKARFTRGNVFTSQYYKNNWLNLYANYNHNRGRGNRLEEEFINFSNGNTNELFHSNLDRNSWFRTHNFKLNSEFTLSPKSSLTLGAQLYYNPNWKARNTTDSEILDNNTITSTFFTLNNSKNFTKNLSFNGDYQLKFNDNESLNITAYFTDYKRDGNQTVATDFYNANNTFTNNNTFTTFSLQTTNIFSAQADYKQVINDTSTLELGGKFADVSSKSSLEHFNLVDNSNVLDLTKTNTFKYNEQNIAGYISYETAFGKFSLKTGLRGEYTNLKGTSVTLNEVNESDYFKLFPTLYLQYSANDNHQFVVNYGKRISRPNYSSLNPFKFYYGDYSFYEGNPKLQPSISHNLEFQYTLKNAYNFELYYNYQTDYITEINFQNNDTNQLRYSFVNVPKNESFGFSFNTNITINDRFSIYTQHNVYYDQDVFTALENNNSLIKNDIWGYYGYVSANYSFLKDKSLTAELSGYLVTDGIQGSMRIEGSQDLSFGLTKTLFNKRATLSLQISDILRSQIVKVSTNYLNQNNYFIDNQETQYVRLGFRYNLGNQKLKKAKSGSKIEEQNRL